MPWFTLPCLVLQKQQKKAAKWQIWIGKLTVALGHFLQDLGGTLFCTLLCITWLRMCSVKFNPL